jgi:hypothetical protein
MVHALSILTSVHFLLHYENKDSQQFNQYNHLSPQLIEHENTTAYLGQAQRCGCVKPVNGITTLPS